MGGGKFDRNVTYSSNLPKALIQFLSGGIAGSTAKTCSAPLDRVKILYQVSEGGGVIVAEGFWLGCSFFFFFFFYFFRRRILIILGYPLLRC